MIIEIELTDKDIRGIAEKLIAHQEENEGNKEKVVGKINPDKNNDEVLDKKQAADFLKIGQTKLAELMKEKDIPFSKIDRRVLFTRKDLIEYVNNKKVM